MLEAAEKLEFERAAFLRDKIKKIEYLIPPQDIFNDAIDVFVTLDDNYCTNNFCYVVEVTTPKFLSAIIKKENNFTLDKNFNVILIND